MSADLVPAHPIEDVDQGGELARAFNVTRGSPATRDSYARDLWSWPGYCAWVGLDPLDAWPGNVSMWLAALTELGEAGTTRARRLAAVSSWYA